jgi:hypothetical protein
MKREMRRIRWREGGGRYDGERGEDDTMERGVRRIRWREG